MKYLAVLFDLDGTLLDTLQDLADATNRTLARHGFPTHPADAYRYFVGDGVKNLLLRALPAGARDEQTLRACIDTYREDYGKNWANASAPYAGVPEMLDGLVERGLKLSVLSNKPHDFTLRCVMELLPRWRFDVVLGASSDFPNKPDPASALHVAGLLKTSPEQVLYLGDTATDMQTATAAGMFPAGALWGFRTADELAQAGARVLLRHPLEVLPLIDARPMDAR